MVVLDHNNYGMLSNTTNENHYIIPDPATHPPSLDAKNSPLALLAQTCSQIGADSSNAKPLLSSMERAAKKPSSTSSNSSCANSTDRSSSANQQQQHHHQHQQPPPLPQPARYKSPSAAAAPETKSPESKLAFKPYEPIVLTRKSDSTRPPSGHTTIEACEERKSSSSRASSRKSASASPPTTHTVSPRDSAAAKLSTSPATATAATDSSKPQTPLEASTPTPSRTSSVDASSYAMLKDSFKPPFSLSPLGGYGCNGCPTLPGLDPTNPAFRSAYANGAAAHLPHPMLLDAASCFQSSTPSPYLSYTRVKTPTGSEAVVPVCKDPYCFSCRYTMHGVGPCPPGCVQCEPKMNAAAAAAMLMSHPFAGYQYGRPYVCNWVGVGGNEYCGKRFRNSDELLQHLRSHTSTTDPVALMNHLSRYPGGAVNPLAAAAAARYHPYAKPGSLPASLAASPFSAFNPALAPYYSPYSLYDQRIGAAVNP